MGKIMMHVDLWIPVPLEEKAELVDIDPTHQADMETAMETTLEDILHEHGMLPEHIEVDIEEMND